MKVKIPGKANLGTRQKRDFKVKIGWVEKVGL
jgi:hypothetical protein